MSQHQDALLAAARLILAVNQIVTDSPGSQVASVGRIEVAPGLPNVIPGRAGLSLELRDLSMERIDSLFESIQTHAINIAEETGTEIRFILPDATAEPTLTDANIRRILVETALAAGLETTLLTSGAGHDAQNIAHIALMGMIFDPSLGGISHSADEFTAIGAVAKGVEVLLGTVLRLDEEQ